MFQKLMTAACCMLLLSSLSAFVSFAQNVGTQAVLTVSESVLKEGETVDVDVAIHHVSDLYGVQFALEFDANKLEFISEDINSSYSNYASNACEMCAEGRTLLYPLIRGSMGDTGFKEQVQLGTFTFKAIQAGGVRVGIADLKAVSTDKFVNESGREDLQVITIADADPLQLTIQSGNTPTSPPNTGDDNPGNGNNPGNDQKNGIGKQLVELIRSEANKQKAAELAKELLSKFDGKEDPQLREEVILMVEYIMKELLVFSPTDQVQRGNKSYFTADVEMLRDLIETSVSLREAAEGKGLSVRGPGFIQMTVDDANGGAVSLSSEVLKLLEQSGLDFSLQSSGANLVFPIQTLLRDTDEEIHVSIHRTQGQEYRTDGAVYRSDSVFDFEVGRYWNNNQQPLDTFDNGVEVTVEYGMEGLDPEMLGFYYYNEAQREWEYIRSGKNDVNNSTFAVTLPHFSRYAVMEYAKEYKDLTNVYTQAVRAIEVLSARHIVQGLDEQHFAPFKSMTRAEFVTVLAKALDWELSSYSDGFKDVHTNDWHAAYVETAYRMGVTQGYQSEFRPNDPVTREEMVVMLMRAYPSQHAEAPSYDAERFTDDHHISEWAKDAVYAARNLGLVNGTGDNRFAPRGDTVRADMAVLFYNMLKSLE